MEVLDPNNVKIYNLSKGKTLPEWLSARKRKDLVKDDIDIRQRIELLQDFEMPDISNTVKVSKDGQYVLATGIYKPRVRCYDVNNLAMKFERCMDAEIITFEMLSDDYSKVVFLQELRFVEFHAAGGTYHKLRIPKFGRDLKYHYPSCDLYLVASGSEIYRLNLERGQFLNSLQMDATEGMRININPQHQLVTVGTKDGRVEAWDPRQRKRVGVLDCAFSAVTEHTQVEGFPSVTALQNLGPLTLGVGTATGQILIYDIRSDKPLFVKDHMYGYPIKDIAFHDDYVLSIDSAVLKIWNRNDGKIFTSIEAGDKTLFNNLCHYPGSGLLFMANDSPKIQTYYIPELGPAPKWCSFLDSLTEELEESKIVSVYDDYKFVTKKELEELELSHLIGSDMLRGYLHGYFMSIKLYNRAKALTQPFSYEEFKRKKIRERIEKDRKSRVSDKALPKINRELAQKLMDDAVNPKKKTGAESILHDDRFGGLFSNPDFQINMDSDEYRLLHPSLSRYREKEALRDKFTAVEEEEMEAEKQSSGDESFWSSDEEAEKERMNEAKAEQKKMRRERDLKERQEKPATRMYEIKDNYQANVRDIVPTDNRLPLGRRIVPDEKQEQIRSLSFGNREMTFQPERKRKRDSDHDTRIEHQKERRALGRKVPAPNTTRNPKYGKRRR